MRESAFLLPLAGMDYVAAATPPQPGTRDLKTLSLHDRVTLPALTKVAFGSGTTTIGALRANHAALMASRNPSAQTVNFVPPSGGFTTTGWCDTAPGYFTLQVDQHGAVQVADAGAWLQNLGSTEQFCFTQVKFKQ